ncbi:hypothetical protein AAVH_09708 [Aphelenchoides avenae]|nr:hypothetical protein AAVH_09708 [Aphelenchus avenae]
MKLLLVAALLCVAMYAQVHALIQYEARPQFTSDGERIYYDRWQCQNICVSGKCEVLTALNPRKLRQGAHMCRLGGRMDDAVLDLRPGRYNNYEGELVYTTPT